jgi:preprotein translocase subunit SecG
MYSFIIVVIGLIGLLMTVVVLLQSGQGGGLAGIAAGDSTRQVLGARQAPDLLEKATWTFATLFIVLCVLANFALDSSDQQESIIQQEAQQQQQQQQAPGGQQQGLPGGGGQGGGAGQGGPRQSRASC